MVLFLIAKIHRASSEGVEMGVALLNIIIYDPLTKFMLPTLLA